VSWTTRSITFDASVMPTDAIVTDEVFVATTAVPFALHAYCRFPPVVTSNVHERWLPVAAHFDASVCVLAGL
jgi:hypothetical protein